MAIVDFEALEGGEAVVGLDDFFGDGGDGTAIGGEVAHALGASERGHDRASDLALKSEEVHTAAAREALAKYLLALSASLWTSSKEGMRSSHSRRVAVWPTRWMARS